MITKKYRLDLYSEWVIRNSLYWMSAHTTWELESAKSDWVIKLFSDDLTLFTELERLLNDYILREIVSVKTEGVRDKIALSVLTNIEKRLSE